MSLIPQIRFKGFTENWEQHKLKDISFFIDGNYGAKYPKDSEFMDSGIPFFTSAVIGKNGIFNRANVKYISKDKNNELIKAQSYGGDLVLTNRGASMGAIAEIPLDFDQVNIGPQLTRITADKDNNNLFLLALLKTPYYSRKIISMNAGSAMNFVGLDTLGKFSLLAPNLREQLQIGSFFKQIDDTIDLHQRQLELLKEQKKGFLQKMFPKNGASKPEIRFSGFTCDWEQRKLKDYVGHVISDGDWIEKEHIHGFGVYRIIQTGNLGIGEFHDKSSSAKYMNEESFNILNANEIFPNDILISRLADPAGRTIILPYTKNKMVTAVDVTIIRPNNLFDSYFFITEMNSSVVLNKISKSVSGTSHKRISRKNLELILLLIPSLEEQQKIGAFFKKLDETIALHQHKLELLKEQKKGFLQKMFV